MKRCSRCKIEKEIDEFGVHTKEKDGHYSQCRECAKESNREAYARNPQKWKDYAVVWKNENRERVNELARKRYDPEKARESDLKRIYGLTLEEYNSMMLKQGGKCCICGGKEKKALHVDHDHITGKVRGLLCRRCNVVLGFVEENLNILDLLKEYIYEHA